VAVARSFSDGSAICYILQVLWMTLLHIIQRMGRIRDNTYVSSSSPGGGIRDEVCAFLAFPVIFTAWFPSKHLNTLKNSPGPLSSPVNVLVVRLKLASFRSWPRWNSRRIWFRCSGTIWGSEPVETFLIAAIFSDHFCNCVEQSVGCLCVCVCLFVCSHDNLRTKWPSG